MKQSVPTPNCQNLSEHSPDSCGESCPVLHVLLPLETVFISESLDTEAYSHFNSVWQPINMAFCTVFLFPCSLFLGPKVTSEHPGLHIYTKSSDKWAEGAIFLHSSTFGTFTGALNPNNWNQIALLIRSDTLTYTAESRHYANDSFIIMLLIAGTVANQQKNKSWVYWIH